MSDQDRTMSASSQDGSNPPSSPLSPLRSAAQQLRRRVSSSASATAAAAKSSWDSALAQGQAVRRQVRALLSTDLRRLPDVQALILSHWHQLEHTSHILINQVIATSDDVKKAICECPQMDELVLSNLADYPEWRDYLQPLLMKGINPADALATVLMQQPSLQLPEMITSRLVQMDDIRVMVTEKVLALEQFSDQIYDSLEANMHRLMDFQRVVASNINTLPNLQLLLKEHHLSRMPALKDFANAPRWLRDNEYIHSGYRPESLDIQRTLESLFYLHNEFGNIWTHLLGAICFFVFAGYILNFVIHDHRWLDKMTFFFFWSTAIGCMICSAVFHTMFSHSYSVYMRFIKLDYLGIVVLILGSIEAVIYFTFYCKPWLALGYMTLTLIFGVAAGTAVLSRAFDGLGKKHIRVQLFVALGATAVFPTIHYAAITDYDTLVESFNFFWLFGVSVPLYLFGAYIYMKRIPECWFPGKFDIWFHSHQLWHIFVILAAYAHYRCIFNMSHYRQITECPVE
eukprot:TRINITY_DN8138_c0_g1_i3.p1 TRINITY_DN8138_c0_g1~~TRINITY_DN8138_c0_g1_i3.p1  ORF type:complete len:514 (+),score=89.43 TRINITY_DN8138_c0_g1_i3:140-1681(+)